MSLSIVATDFSGSTQGNQIYHSIALKYLKEFSSKHKNLICLQWATYCEIITLDKMIEKHEAKQGDCATYPQKIPKWIRNHLDVNLQINIMIITDGHINKGDVDECTRENAGLKYINVDFVVISTDGSNLSVGASFFASSNINIYHNEKKIKTICTSDPFDYNTITIDNFHDKINELNDYIRVKFMASEIGMLEECDKLLKLKHRLIRQSQSIDAKKILLEPRTKTGVLSFIKTFKFYKLLYEGGNIVQNIEQSISSLLNFLHSNQEKYCLEPLDFVKTKQQFKLGKVDDVEEEDIDSNSIPQSDEIKFTDIVTLEDSSCPVVLLYEYNLVEKIWKSKTYSQFRNTIACPLFLLLRNDMDVIGQAYDINTYKNLLDNDIRTDPKNRRPFLGGIIPRKEADKYNDYIIVKTFLNSKQFRISYGLMYFVLYKLIDKTEWIDISIKAKFKEYAYYRLSTGQCLLAFVNYSSFDPSEYVVEHLACYYCSYISSLLFGKDKDFYKLEKLRMYYKVSHFMVEITRELNYEIDEKFVFDRSEQLHYISTLKRIPKKNDKTYYIMSKIFEYKSIGETNFLIPQIKNENNIKFLQYLDFNHEDMMKFCTNIDISLKNYIFTLYYCESKHVPLCADTLRPYFVIDKKSYYSELSNIINEYKLEGNIFELTKCEKKISFLKLLSLYQMYINFVYKYEKYPSIEEFALYVHKKKRYHDEKIVLFPENTVEQITEVYSKYEQFKTMPVEEFIKTASNSMDLKKRISIEGSECSDLQALIRDKKSFIETDQTKLYFYYRSF